MKIGSVLKYNDAIYIVTNIRENGEIVLQLCGEDEVGLFVVPGVTLYVNSTKLKNCTILGEMEVI